MKKLMCLGGNYFQATAVKAAKRLGYYVIDVDYLPNNPAHKYADEYYNISTLDKESVLSLADEKKIDGILSYASDVSAPTAAYVAEKMGLPTNPYDSVYLMTRKDLFHPFLKKHGFYVPESVQVKSLEDAVKFWNKVDRPVMIKPADSSGSKGVGKAENRNQLKAAYEEAEKYAKDGVMVAEVFIQRDNYQIAGDAFVADGKIAYFGIANEHFDRLANPFVPIGESFPAVLDEEKKAYARAEIQRAVELLGLKNGAVNLDFMFDREGRLFIIELGPRNGGNLITDAICLSSGLDLAECTVRAALGEEVGVLEDQWPSRYISSYIYHSVCDGIFDGLEYGDVFRSKIRRSDIFVKKGEKAGRYENGGFGLGAALLEFGSEEEMLYMMDHMEEFCRVCIKQER